MQVVRTSKSIISIVIVLLLCLTATIANTQSATNEVPGNLSADTGDALPIPLPVEIVEDAEAIELQHRLADQARQREIADLAAQQGMDASARAMNDATQDMRDYSLYSTILVAVGTVMLGITLWLTRQANNAAQAAVFATKEIGINQLRPWVCSVTVENRFGSNIRTERGVSENALLLRVIWRNDGQSPAVNCLFFNAVRVISPEEETPTFSPPDGLNSGILAVGNTNSGSHKPIVFEDFDEVLSGNKVVILYGLVRYRDALGSSDVRESQACFRCWFDGIARHPNGHEEPIFQISVEGPQNTAT